MVSGYPTSMNLSRVDGLSTDPRDLGYHKKYDNHIETGPYKFELLGK